MLPFKWGMFLFCFCLTLLLGQLRLHPDCPKWLRPTANGTKFPLPVICLLVLGMLVGLVIHFKD